MGRRSNEGFHRSTLDAWVEASKAQDDPDKQMVGLLLPFTGLRVDEFRHIHGPTWFSWKNAKTGETVDGGPPEIIVPASAPCHIDGDTVPCGSCEEDGGFTTKFDDRRRIPLVETWNNWNRGSHDTYEAESINLPERVKNYFKVTEDDYGNAMIAGDGVTSKTINRWVKQIADDADIGLERGYTQIATLEDPVPDVFPHDMRGTFIMQLIRNNMHRTKLIKYTGHDLVSSLAPYESRVASETDAREFLDHI